MIELRILKKNKLTIKPRNGPVSVNRPLMKCEFETNGVLQYREREGPRGEGWWGDWKDVPIVEEGE